MNSIRSASYKFIKIKGHLLHIIAPILMLLAFCLYFTGSKFDEKTKVTMFFDTLCIMMPMMISIAITIQYEAEKKAGGFQNLLSYPGKRLLGHLSNFFIVLVWGMIAVSIAVAGMGIIMNQLGNTEFSLVWYIKMIPVVYFSNICWYVIAYMVCYTLGNGISLGLGVLASAIAGVMLVLGDNYWQFVPNSYSIRIVGTKIRMGSKKIADAAINMKKELLCVYIITGIAILLYVIWASFWQGSRASE